MPRYRLTVAYDGTDFLGWWRQPGSRTVAGEFDAAFARLGEPSAQAVGSSRTDTGVHARGQVAHVDCQRTWHPDELQRALDRQLPLDVRCRRVESCADDWHAVHGISGKLYRYRLHLGPLREPFLARRIAWCQEREVPLPLLRESASLVSTTSDFSAFSRRGEHREDLTCRLAPVRWYDAGGYRICAIRGDRFAYRLVRSLVGGMVAVATGTVTLAQWHEALAGHDTPAARQQAPAHGLCLERVLLREITSSARS